MTFKKLRQCMFKLTVFGVIVLLILASIDIGVTVFGEIVRQFSG